MANKVSLDQFSEYVQARDRLSTLEQQRVALAEEREVQALRLRESNKGIGINDRAQALIDNRLVDITSLAREVAELDESIELHDRAIDLQRQTVRDLHGQASHRVCLPARPAIVQQIRRLLNALKEVCDANAEIGKIRNSLERSNVATGSLPPATFACGSWDDPHGSQVTSYRKWVDENYPEHRKLNG